MRNFAKAYLGVVGTVLLLVTIPTNGVIIEAGIFDQSDPFAPPRWDVGAVVLVEVFPKETCRKKRMAALNRLSLTIRQNFINFVRCIL